jgi:hypothetical protein
MVSNYFQEFEALVNMSKIIIAAIIEFVPISEDLKNIKVNSIQRTMIAALKRHSSHALRETDLCSPDSDDTASSDSSTSPIAAHDDGPLLLPTQERSIP